MPVTRFALESHEDQYAVLAGWVGEVASPADALLDIGAGDGDDEYSSQIRPLVGRFVGVDPDARSEQNRALDEWYPMNIEAFAAKLTTTGRGQRPSEDLPESPAQFDVALAVYVAEHIEDPVAFLSACRSCLRPGGSLFVVTPNLWHYFGAGAKVAMTLRIDDRLLAALRRHQDGRGHHDHHGHRADADHTGLAAHFPMSYRMNTVRAMGLAALEAGFSALEVRHLENPAVFETYFPGRLVAIPRTYARLVHRLRLEAAFGTLICRLVN